MNFQLFKRKFLIFSCYDLIFSCPEKDRKRTNRYPCVKRERIEGWEERRRREAMGKPQTSELESSVQTRSSLEISVSDSGVASDASLFSKTPNPPCLSLESYVATSKPGESLHLRHMDNKVFVAKKEVSALVAGFKGRDLLADRMSRQL